MVLVGVLGLCAALPSQDTRAVANPTTPNQILDAIFERAVTKIRALNWHMSKRVQNGNSEIPLDVNSGGANSAETFSISSATVSGLGSLRRSASGSFNSDKTVLRGTAVLEDATLNADYKVTFPGIGQAPAQTVNGKVAEKVSKLFADIEVNLLNGVPQSIRKYTVRSGHDNLDKVTNLNGNAMAPIHTAGFRKALRQILEKTMSSNMKVQINKAIQDMRNGV
ncbi:hypothetical protein Pmani_013907 [Petrolisthes manimaculis]|uniref:Uncharacterized protein n=1 Tax=Petrolisthes manimaculis TaxID=1843537 RepID=A0AAE1U970_9EUCA|nr:hypothetical protein Pmani_013907 [Petrolisthes manimaculis]